MRPRRLSPDERALWDKVVATVRPLHAPVAAPLATDKSASPAGPGPRVRRTETVPLPRPVAAPATRIAHTLDGSWDKRLTKGDVWPDMTIDLHGETLASAHARLNRSLAAAVRQGARVVLLVTGKPAVDNPRLPPTSRGVIRASVSDWLSASPCAGQIAAIRNAHPRHGGAGALYVILRRERS